MKRILLALLLLALCGLPAYAGLPLTPSTTYVPNSTPAIKAQDLNDLQKYLAGLYSSIYSVKALVIDGTGGASVTGTAGSLKVSRQVTGTTAPTTTVALGELPVAMVAACWAKVNTAGNLQRGANVASVTRNGAGDYTVVCNAQPAHPDHTAALGTLLNAFGFIAVSTQDDGAGKLRVNIATANTGGAATDQNFHFIVFAE